MAEQTILELVATSEAETRRIAERLAPRLCAGDAIMLSGPIGAGKSVFARALIQARLRATGRFEEVPSPTYTLVQAYDDGVTEIWHADLYRLEGVADADELGLDEAFDSAVCLVEWPERLAGAVPRGALRLDILPEAGSSRRLRFSSDDPARWRHLDLAETARCDE